MRVNFGSSDHALFNACYRHKDRQYIRAAWQGFRHCVQVENDKSARLKFQADQI